MVPSQSVKALRGLGQCLPSTGTLFDRSFLMTTIYRANATGVTRKPIPARLWPVARKGAK